MHIYLDEAGDTAPRSRPSASRYFALAAVVIEDRDAVERAIQSLRKETGFYQEFKSHKTPIEIRTALLRRAVLWGLYFDVMVLDKTALSDYGRHWKSVELYRAVSEELLVNVTRDLANAILVVDEVDEQRTESLKRLLRDRVNPVRPSRRRPRRIKKIVGYDSRRDDLLQLADVVAGSIFRAKERGDRRALEVIEARVRWHKFSGEK